MEESVDCIVRNKSKVEEEVDGGELREKGKCRLTNSSSQPTEVKECWVSN